MIHIKSLVTILPLCSRGPMMPRGVSFSTDWAPNRSKNSGWRSRYNPDRKNFNESDVQLSERLGAASLSDWGPVPPETPRTSYHYGFEGFIKAVLIMPRVARLSDRRCIFSSRVPCILPIASEQKISATVNKKKKRTKKKQPRSDV